MDPKNDTQKVETETPAEPVVNTEPISESAPAPQIPSDPQEPTEISATEVGYTETESSKLIYILVGVLAIILLSLVGLFFYKQTTSIPSIQPTPTPGLGVEETAEANPTDAPAAGDEAELQQIQIPDIDEELKEIENEINQL